MKLVQLAWPSEVSDRLRKSSMATRRVTAGGYTEVRYEGSIVAMEHPDNCHCGACSWCQESIKSE